MDGRLFSDQLSDYHLNDSAKYVLEDDVGVGPPLKKHQYLDFTSTCNVMMPCSYFIFNTVVSVRQTNH
jgi:hypothetical protein